MTKSLTGGDVFGDKGNTIIFEIFFILPSLHIRAGQKIKHTYFTNILSAKIAHVNLSLF